MADRERLDDTREGLTRRFEIPRPSQARVCPACGHKWDEERTPFKMFVTVNTYKDGRPGEIFISCDKAGELTHAAFDAIALCVSVALQYGAPIKVFVDKFKAMRFQPNGFTGDSVYKNCSSVLDLLAQWLGERFSDKPV